MRIRTARFALLALAAWPALGDEPPPTRPALTIRLVEPELEARRVIELPAARLAARRRVDGDLRRLEAASADDARPHGTDERYRGNTGFHTSLMAASGNALLEVAAERDAGLLVFGPHLGRVGRMRFRRAARRIRSEAGCLVWIAPDG